MRLLLHRIAQVLFPAVVHGWLVWVYIAAALVVGTLILLGLMSVAPRYRKLVVAGITFLAGLYFSLEFLLPHEPVRIHFWFRWFSWFKPLHGPLHTSYHPVHVVDLPNPVARFANGLTNAKPGVADWAMIIGSFALLLGTSNLFAIHGRAVKKKTSGWYNSLAFFITFFAIMIVGFLKDGPIHGLNHQTAQAIQSVSNSLYLILFNGFVQSLDATMFSLIAFYIVSAAYRAFRVRSAEAGLMMGTAGIIMLGLVPVGAWLTSWLPHTGPLASLRLESITYWLLIWPNMAVQRAIEFGLAIGAVAMSLRIWLSLERGSFFDRQL